MSGHRRPESSAEGPQQPSDLTVDLRGAVSVVVGGSSGIGLAAAIGLARAGSAVLVASNDLTPLQQPGSLPDDVAEASTLPRWTSGVPRTFNGWRVMLPGPMVHPGSWSIAPA